MNLENLIGRPFASQPFDATFGKSKQRKRPRLTTDSLSELLTNTQSTTNECVASAAHSCPQRLQLGLLYTGWPMMNFYKL